MVTRRAVFAVATAAAIALVLAQSASVRAQSRALEVVTVRGGISMIASAGGNMTVQVGRDGVLVVDTLTTDVSEPALTQIRQLSEAPVRFVINTGIDADHIGGNSQIASSGQILAGGNTRAATVYSSGGAPIYAHENVLKRLSTGGGEAAGWPTDTYFVAQKDLFVNGEPVQLMHMPAAHTDGDTLVIFRRTDVVSTGDIFTPDRYPVIDLERGGSISGLLNALNALIRITVPESNQQGGTLVIPGHGRLSDESDVAEYRDMVTIVRDRIQDMVKKGLTLEQVKAAKPTFDYDPIYGADKGAIFIEQVYRSLRNSK